MNLYDVDMRYLMIDLVETVREYHPELSKKDVKLLIMNALLGNVVREELLNQIDFLIENDGWIHMNEEDAA